MAHAEQILIFTRFILFPLYLAAPNLSCLGLGMAVTKLAQTLWETGPSNGAGRGRKE